MGEHIKQEIDRHVQKLLDELANIKTSSLQRVDSIRQDFNRFLAVSETFLQYTTALRERGSATDIVMSGDDLLARAASLQLKPVISSGDGGTDYRLPDVTFQPCHVFHDLLTNDEQNVVGRIVSIPRCQDGSRTSDYCLSPVSVRTIQEDSHAVLGIACLSGHIYIIRAEMPEVEVYSAVTWSLRRRLAAVDGLKSPTDLVACQQLNCLYVSDWFKCCIHRVDLDVQVPQGQGQLQGGSVVALNSHDSRINLSRKNSRESDSAGVGDVCKYESSWSVDDQPWSLSLVDGQQLDTVSTSSTSTSSSSSSSSCCTSCSSLLVTCDVASKLKQYTLHGSLLRQICLNVTAGLNNPRHAILLTTGQFVVSLTDSIWLLGPDGRRIVRKKPESRTPDSRINTSGRLALDSRGPYILVLDVDGRRIVQLDSGLGLIREVVSCDDRLRYPARLCLDIDRGRLYVADNALTNKSLLSMGKFWGKTGRVVVYDTNIVTMTST
jgi:hypothetical protein